MKKNKIISMLLLVFIMFSVVTCVFAASQSMDGGGSSGSGGSSSGDQSDDFWNAATDWFGRVNKDEQLGNGVTNVVNTLTGMVSVVGTTVFVIVTIFLGIKYMYGSVEAKANVKESLVSLLVACVFFFGWDALSNLLFPSNDFIFLQSGDTSYEQMVGRVFAFATYIAQFLAIIAIVYVGVRYIFAGAEGKASLKGKSAVFLIGIILTFCATSFLGLISDIVNESINGSANNTRGKKNSIVIQETIQAKEENILKDNPVFRI